MKKYESLKLVNQLCFPLYAASKEVVKGYHAALSPLGLTYTQYITMLALWEYGEMNVKELGEKLYLDSGTLTPLLKGLERKGLLRRVRATSDERMLRILLTDEGTAMRDQALEIPQMCGTLENLTEEEAKELYRLCYKLVK